MKKYDISFLYTESTGLCPICKIGSIWGYHLNTIHNFYVEYFIHYTEFSGWGSTEITRIPAYQEPSSIYTRQRVLR